MLHSWTWKRGIYAQNDYCKLAVDSMWKWNKLHWLSRSQRNEWGLHQQEKTNERNRIGNRSRKQGFHTVGHRGMRSMRLPVGCVMLWGKKHTSWSNSCERWWWQSSSPSSPPSTAVLPLSSCSRNNTEVSDWNWSQIYVRNSIKKFLNSSQYYSLIQAMTSCNYRGSPNTIETEEFPKQETSPNRKLFKHPRPEKKSDLWS
jgi:hypothetical protein